MLAAAPCARPLATVTLAVLEMRKTSGVYLKLCAVRMLKALVVM
jgi:hypothetical protein